MILAAHQNSFIPWLPFFDKMNKANVFVLMENCQFEKNGWTNRCRVWEEYWTMPVERGMKPIKEKFYVNGYPLVTVNNRWIFAIAATLGIRTEKIRHDFPTKQRGTYRLIEMCKRYECDSYLANPEAEEKYLDIELMNRSGIRFIPHVFNHKIHVFEAFDKFGIEGTVKLLAKEKKLCGI